MSRYIDADKAPIYLNTTACEQIKYMPTADVQEVKRGKWKKQKGRPEAVCSECGKDVVCQIVNDHWQFENYCPRCGTKMS